MTLGRTSQSGILSGNELREEVPEQRLKGRCLAEKKPPRGQEHVVRVPRLGAVEERVAGVKRPSQTGVVRRVQCVEGIEDVFSHSRRIDEEVLDECIEGGVFFTRRHTQIAYRTTERCALVELANTGEQEYTPNVI